MKRNYVNAFISLLLEGKSYPKVFSGLHNTLTNRGHQNLLVPILKSVSREIDGKLESRVPVVKVSNKELLAKYKHEIEADIKELLLNEPKTVIDETLIGGYVLSGKHKQIDRSYKAKLLKLYREVIKSN